MNELVDIRDVEPTALTTKGIGDGWLPAEFAAPDLGPSPTPAMRVASPRKWRPVARGDNQSQAADALENETAWSEFDLHSGALLVLNHWEGIVTRIEGDSFFATLTDIFDPSNQELGAEFPTAEVSEIDKDLLAEGAAFRWIIGRRKRSHGTEELVSKIVFRRLPRWTPRQLDRVKTKAQQLAARIAERQRKLQLTENDATATERRPDRD